MMLFDKSASLNHNINCIWTKIVLAIFKRLTKIYDFNCKMLILKCFLYQNCLKNWLAPSDFIICLSEMDKTDPKHKGQKKSQYGNANANENLSFQVVYVTCHGLIAPDKRFCSELWPWWFRIRWRLLSLSPLSQLTSNMATYVKLPYSKKKLKRYAKPLYGLNSTEWKLCTHFYRLTGHPQRITQPPRHIKTYRRRNNTTKQINHSP